MYQIVSSGGWRSGAVTEQDARFMADAHHKQWWNIGCPVDVSVYYLGELVYTATGEPNESVRREDYHQ